MKMRLVLFASVIFLLAGMFSLEAQNSRGKRGGGLCEQAAVDRAETITWRLIGMLQLDEKQSEEVQAIYLDFFEKREACLDDNKKGNSDKKGRGGKGMGNREPDAECVLKNKDLDAELAMVFTKEQMTKYTKEVEKRKSKKVNETKRARGKC